MNEQISETPKPLPTRPPEPRMFGGILIEDMRPADPPAIVRRYHPTRLTKPEPQPATNKVY